jgi:hypothetical protein
VDPNGSSDKTYIFILNGNIDMRISGKGVKISDASNFALHVKKSDRNGLALQLAPNASVSILANNGTGKVTLHNSSNENRSVDLGGAIDDYDNFLAGLEKDFATYVNYIEGAASDYRDRAIDIVLSVFSVYIQNYAGYDLAETIAQALPENWEGDSGFIDNIMSMVDDLMSASEYRTRLKTISEDYNREYLYEIN